MLRSIVSRLRSASAKIEDTLTKRTYTRHDTDRCVATIRGQAFRVINWSFGGVEIVADDGIFTPGQPVSMTLKFKLRASELEIVHQGAVARSGGGRVSVRFDPLKHNVQRGLQQVADDEHARRTNPG